MLGIMEADDVGTYWVGICPPCFDDHLKGIMANAKERLQAEIQSSRTTTPTKMFDLRKIPS